MKPGMMLALAKSVGDVSGCAEQCLTLLADEPRPAAIACAGKARERPNRHFNETFVRAILAAVGKRQ